MQIITLAIISATRYYLDMIRSFQCSETEKIYQRKHSRKLPQAIQRVAMRKLWVLDAATELNELRIPPHNRLEALRGDRKGQHSIRINQQWRICFRWRSGDAHNVEIVDYDRLGTDHLSILNTRIVNPLYDLRRWHVAESSTPEPVDENGDENG